MGCYPSKPRETAKTKKESTAFKRPQWKSDTVWDENELQVRPLTSEERDHRVQLTGESRTSTLGSLQRKREEFWDTQPAYGGAKGMRS